jgi:hypothetical protein
MLENKILKITLKERKMNGRKIRNKEFIQKLKE